VRSEKWKLHFPHEYRTLGGAPGGKGGKPAKYVQAKTPLALYDLENDRGETTDVSAKHPDVVKKLQRLADQAREELGDTATKTKGKGVRPAGSI
jgi:arylsulfatase A